jgi:hypothetical protein
MEFSLILSSIALLISGTTFWLTYLRKGVIKMSQPTTIFLGNDGGDSNIKSPKIYLRTILYSTSKKGNIIESMYLKIRRGESVQNFNIWVYGNEKLYRGSGLFVGAEGVTANHHFLLPKDGTNFIFLPGESILEVYCTLVNRKKSRLFTVILNLTEIESKALENVKKGIYFDWGPDSEGYNKFIDEKPDKPVRDELSKLIEKL